MKSVGERIMEKLDDGPLLIQDVLHFSRSKKDKFYHITGVLRKLKSEDKLRFAKIDRTLYGWEIVVIFKDSQRKEAWEMIIKRSNGGI